MATTVALATQIKPEDSNSVAKILMPTSLNRPAQSQISSQNAASISSAMNSNSPLRSEEHTSELQSLMRISYAVFCLKKKNNHTQSNLSTLYITLLHILYLLIPLSLHLYLNSII